jgi:hypothetical protein
VNEVHPCTTSTTPVNDVHQTSERGSPKLLKNCERTAKRQTDSPTPLPKPPDGLTEIPVKPPVKGKPTPVTWWLTEATRDKIEAEYPNVDVVALAEDMARKIRAGAREPYSYRGMTKALASLVAAEAKGGGNRTGATQSVRTPGRSYAEAAETSVERWRKNYAETN